MTSLDRPVRRVTRGVYRFGGRPAKLVVQLGDGDVPTLREQRRRYAVTLPLHWCYIEGVRQRVARERFEKKAARKAAQREGRG